MAQLLKQSKTLHKSEGRIDKMTIFAPCKQKMIMATVSLKTIEQNDNVSLFSICFEGSEESEFEKFMLKVQGQCDIQ